MHCEKRGHAYVVQVPKEAKHIGCSWSWTLGGCELSDMDPENQTGIICKGSECS